MQNKFIPYQGIEIHYRVYGTGKPVVLIHGFGEDGEIWDEIIARLNYQFIVPDLAGSGRSGLPGEEFSLAEHATVTRSILEIENIPVCTMIGHSMGGYITLAFAEKYPALLSSFGLFHSSAFADDEAKKETRLKAIDFIKAKGSYSFLKTSIPNLFAGNEHQAEMEALIEKGKNFTKDALISYYRAMIDRPDRTHVLKSFTGPILFIIGEKDTAIPLEASLKQCYLPARSHVFVLDTGHMGMIELPERSADILRSFLEGV